MIIQMTTEAVGVYSAAEQIAAVKALRPTFASLAIRELVPNSDHETAAQEFFNWLQEHSIVPQFILYVPEDLTLFLELKERGIIPFKNPYLLFVLGRYSVNQQSSPADMEPFLEIFGNRKWPFMVCAFGAQEAACMRAAMDAGGHARVGFENNLLLPDGSMAENNAALVKSTVDEANNAGKQVMTAEEISAFLAACLV